MSNGHNRQFLSAWLRNPMQTGALLPSGSGLARAMAAQVVPGPGMVVELGTGTGVITGTPGSARIHANAEISILSASRMGADFTGMRFF